MSKTIPPNIDMPNQTANAKVSKTEEELRTLRLAVEQSHDGINIVDLEGAIIYVNPASEAMYGYLKGQLVGRHVSILNVDPEVSETQILPAVLSTGSWSGAPTATSSRNSRTKPTCAATCSSMPAAR